MVKSQIIRFKRICSEEADFHHACNTLFSVLRKRGYTYSFLRKIKRDLLYSLPTQGRSMRCGKPRCGTCKHIKETSMIEDKNGSPIGIQSQLNCQSKHLIYVIECSNCKIRYVGETCQKLKDRMNQHRSDINRKQNTAIATHFSQNCPNVEFFQVIPVEKVYSIVPESYIFMSVLDNTDEIQLIQKEQYWIKKQHINS